MKTAFLLSGRHTDSEINDFLQRKASKGLFLEDSKGNFLLFKKGSLFKCLCSYTVSAGHFAVPAEWVLDEELRKLKELGWSRICIGAIVNLLDTRRGMFLASENPEAEIPKSSDKIQKLLFLNSLKTILGNLLLLAAFVFAVLFGYNKYAGSASYELFLKLVTIPVAVSFIFSFTALVYLLARIGKITCKPKTRLYRFIDYSVVATAVLIVVTTACLLFIL